MTALKQIIDIALKDFSLFKNCSDTFFDAMKQQGRRQNFSKGKILFIHEEVADCFYYIQSGWVKLFRETLDGTQAIVDVFTTGHIFGETSIFEDGTYPYTAEIAEDADIVVLPISILKTEIETNGKLALDMLTSMARYRRQQDQEIEHRSLQNASQRIGCFLLRLADQGQDGATVINLPYDKMLLASRLGMKPETFSRALAKLKDKTGIKIKGASIEMESLKQLSAYSCLACSSEFPCKDISKTSP